MGGGPPEGGAACSGGYGRSPTQGELAAYASQLAAGADGTSIQIDLLASNEYYKDTGSNPLAFVMRLDDDVLRRDPTPVEVANALATSCDRRRLWGRIELAQEVVLGPEARAIRVDNIFHTLLDRYPDSAELAEWVNQLPGSASTAGTLGTTMVADVAGTSEFYALAGDSPTGFVTKLYSDLLSRPPSATALASSALTTEIAQGDATARVAAASAALASPAFRTAEVTAFFQDYLHPTCRQLTAQECTDGVIQTPTPLELSTALTALASGSTEESIIAGVLGSPQYYENHGYSQTGLIGGVYEDLFGRAPSDAEYNAALDKYSNDSVGHMEFATALVDSLAYQNRVVSLAYQKLLLRAPYPAETNTGEGVLNGGIPSLQTPDETLLVTILTTPEYYADAGGTDSDFVARTIGVLLARQGSTAEISTYLQRSALHDSAWQTGVADAILDGDEYRTEFVRGVYEMYLTFSVCDLNTGSPQGNGGGLASAGITVLLGVLAGALIIGIAVPIVLRRRP